MIRQIRSYIQLLFILFTVLVNNPVKAVEPFPLPPGLSTPPLTPPLPPPPRLIPPPSPTLPPRRTPATLPRLEPSTGQYKLTVLEYPENLSLIQDNSMPSFKELIQFYNQNILWMQDLPLNATTLAISTNEPTQSRLLKERWNVAINIYRLTGRRLLVGRLGDSNDALEEIQIKAIQVLLAEADLANTKENKIAAYETCLSITSKWQRATELMEKVGLASQFHVLTATYWKQYCESRTMEEQR